MGAVGGLRCGAQRGDAECFYGAGIGLRCRYEIDVDARANTCCPQAYDLADPYEWSSQDDPHDVWANCTTIFDPEYECWTPQWMGPLVHPRLKKPVGQRLAASAINLVYGGSHAVTGPTIAGCTLKQASSSRPSSLTLTFDLQLLRESKLLVQPYDTAYANRSAFLALVNESSAGPLWVPLNIALSNSTGAHSIDVDLSPLNGKAPIAIRYAWGALDRPDGDDVRCCMKDPQGLATCTPAQCPIFAAVPGAPFAGLPANPFIAKIVDGKCVCPSPQSCDA